MRVVTRARDERMRADLRGVRWTVTAKPVAAVEISVWVVEFSSTVIMMSLCAGRIRIRWPNLI